MTVVPGVYNQTLSYRFTQYRGRRRACNGRNIYTTMRHGVLTAALQDSRPARRTRMRILLSKTGGSSRADLTAPLSSSPRLQSD